MFVAPSVRSPFSRGKPVHLLLRMALPVMGIDHQDGADRYGYRPSVWHCPLWVSTISCAFLGWLLWGSVWTAGDYFDSIVPCALT